MDSGVVVAVGRLSTGQRRGRGRACVVDGFALQQGLWFMVYGRNNDHVTYISLSAFARLVMNVKVRAVAASDRRFLSLVD